MPRSITLTLLDDSRAAPLVRSFEGDQDAVELVIGRDRNADLVIAHPSISRRHCRIIHQANRFRLERQSKNAVVVDGAAVEAAVELRHGSVIQLGGFRVEVSIDPASEPPQEEPQPQHQSLPERGRPALTVVSEAPWVNAAIGRGERVALDDQELVFGRDPKLEDSGGITLPSPIVSTRHASIVRASGNYELRDLGSANGTFVNGERIKRPRILSHRDTITIGPYRFVFDATEPSLAGEIESECPGIRIDVISLTKVVKTSDGQDKVLLDDVSLTIVPGEFVGVMGELGAGKSQFLKAVTGRELPGPGMIFCDGLDLAQHFESLKASISYVPQQIDPRQTIVHDTLKVDDALRFTCRLRLPPDTSSAEMDGHIERALETVELAEHRRKYIRDLSGGQKKKVAIAMELLVRPRLLLLDEVTAGMDLGNEQQSMRVFRKLANEGTTVLCITHYVDRLKICDMIIHFVAGGRLGYFGPPAGFKRHYHLNDIGDIFDKDRLHDAAGAHPSEYALTQDCREYVQKRGESFPTSPTLPQVQHQDHAADAKENSKRQLSIMVDRYVKLMTEKANMRTLAVLLGLAPAISLLLCILASSIQAPAHIDATTGPAEILEYSKRQNLLCFGSVLTALFLGLFGAVREIVKEFPIYRHEHHVNLQPMPYLLSKIVVLCALGGIQSLSIVFILNWLGGFDAGSFAKEFITLFAASGCGVALGLAISAWVDSPDTAVMAMIAFVILEMLFAGAVVPVRGVSELIAKAFVAAYWPRASLLGLFDSTTQRFLDPGYLSADRSWLGNLILLPIHFAAYSLIAFAGILRHDGPGVFSRMLGALGSSRET